MLVHDRRRYELPDGLIVQDGDSVIVAHIVYNYSPLYDDFIHGDIMLEPDFLALFLPPTNTSLLLHPKIRLVFTNYSGHYRSLSGGNFSKKWAPSNRVATPDTNFTLLILAYLWCLRFVKILTSINWGRNNEIWK